MKPSLKNELIKCALYIGVFGFAESHAMNVQPDAKECANLLNKYDQEIHNSKEYKIEDRLAYLKSIEETCLDNAAYLIRYSEVLFEARQYDKSLFILDQGISRQVQPLGDLLYNKATIIYTLKRAGIGNNYEFVEIKKLLSDALDKGSSYEPVIYAYLAKTAILEEEYQQALTFIESGLRLAKDYRFYSLASIVEFKRKNYRKSAWYMEKAIAIGGEAYMSEPEAVQAISVSLCKLGRNDLAIGIINKSYELNNKIATHPDWLAARKEIKNCEVEVVKKDKL